MIITLLDGQKHEAVIYSQTSSTMRVAINGAEDLVDFTCISGQWVSENCQPVEIEFAWQAVPTKSTVTEADCICSTKLAAELVECLWRGGADADVNVLSVGGTTI